MSNKLWLALGLFALGCDAPVTEPLAQIEGAQFITFRCLVDGPEGQIGLPLEGCGCTIPDGDTVRVMGPVECDCQTVENLQITQVKAVKGRCTGEDCTYERKDGDLIPVAPGGAGSVECVPGRNGEVRAYVGSAERGEVSVLDVTQERGEAGTTAKGVLDVESTIPGINGIFIDDLVSDIESHPDGAFIFTVNSSSGTLSVIREEQARRTAQPGSEDFQSNTQVTFKLDLGHGPLLEATVWPDVGRAKPTPGGPAFAYISAPTEGDILEVDLRVLAAADPEQATEIEGVVTRIFSLPDGARPTRLAVNSDGTRLFVAHAGLPTVTIIDLEDGSARRIDLESIGPCDDGYLTSVVDVSVDPTCSDGIDNDGDGQVDMADEGCTGEVPSEALNVKCPQASECADGIDNDDDGLIDLADPDCAADVQWEGTTPACSDGMDNDGDSLIDRFDPGCRNDRDNDETNAIEVASCFDGIDNDGNGKIDSEDSKCACTQDGSCDHDDLDGVLLADLEKPTGLCTNGIDDDGDGLIDSEDPGCTDRDARRRHSFEAGGQCADGADNDADSATDYPDDTNCYAASDRFEGASRLLTGPRALATARVPSIEGLRSFLYVIDGRGSLVVVDLDSPSLSMKRLRLGAEAQTMTVRQQGVEASLLIVASDTTLRSIEITAPIELRTEGGRPVFARQIGVGDSISTKYYVVDDGIAWAVTGLEAFEDQTFEEGALTMALELSDPVLNFRLPDDLTERTPVMVVEAEAPQRNRGQEDLVVTLPRTQRQIVHAEANVLTHSVGRVNRVVSFPRFFLNGSPTTADPRRNAAFCRMDLPCVDDLEPPTGEVPSCIPAGYDPATLTPASAEDLAQRTQCSFSNYDGIQVIEDDPNILFNETVSVEFEGEIPRSESRTGQHGGIANGGEEWTLLDFDADFCRLGVEPGDVVLVDLLVASNEQAADSEACAALRRQSEIDSERRREPIRYVVVERGAHKLLLGAETRESYAPQLSRDARSRLPVPFPASAPPPFECAAQFIKYRVRVANDQWALVGLRSGFRHPWRNESGLCVEDPARARRKSRVKLGEPFENEYVRFTLGNPLLNACSAEGETADCSLPYLIDSRFEFDMYAGILNQRLIEAALVPGQMRWLPTDDRLYIVDTGRQTVVEIAGLDVFTQVMRIVRSIR